MKQEPSAAPARPRPPSYYQKRALYASSASAPAVRANNLEAYNKAQTEKKEMNWMTRNLAEVATAPGAPRVDKRSLAIPSASDPIPVAQNTTTTLRTWDEANKRHWTPSLRPAASYTPDQLRALESRLYFARRVHNKSDAQISQELDLAIDDFATIARTR